MIALAGLLSGCGSDDAAPSSPVTFMIQDKSLRPAGVECAAVLPLDYLHRGADYKVKDAAGKTVATGKLPPGKSIPAMPDVDFGKAVRMPTYCQMDFALPLAPVAGLSLNVEDGKAIVLKVSSDGRGFQAQIPEDNGASGIPLGDLGGG